jgi:hypothetical protein
MQNNPTKHTTIKFDKGQNIFKITKYNITIKIITKSKLSLTRAVVLQYKHSLYACSSIIIAAKKKEKYPILLLPSRIS